MATDIDEIRADGSFEVPQVIAEYSFDRFRIQDYGRLGKTDSLVTDGRCDDAKIIVRGREDPPTDGANEQVAVNDNDRVDQVLHLNR